MSDGTWTSNIATYDGLGCYCYSCRQDDKTNATGHTKAIAESLITLFALLPDDAWRAQLAQEIQQSGSCSTLTWASGDLEALVVEYSGEDVA